MVFFRKKTREEDIEEIKGLVEGKKPTEIEEKEVKKEPEEVPKEKVEKPAEEKKPIPSEEKKVSKAEEPKRPAFAPLFVKIEKYRAVLNAINDLKTTIVMLKNALSIQKQIEGLRDENRKFLELAINKLDKKIVALDSEFLRPKGFEEEFPPAVYETEGLEGVIDDLKKQIEGLKSELQTIT
jgi:hypothetical protein